MTNDFQDSDMCEHNTRFSKSKTVAEAVIHAFRGSCMPAEEGNAGSRRRKLWDLTHETHCPVIGVCLPMSTLRKLVGKELGETISSDDYDFHVSAVSECRIRRPLSERIQRELETRYAASIRRLSKLKSKEELAAAWAEANASGLVAETLWAALTHPRCNEDLRQQICRDVHMFQHQAGAAARADLNRLTKLKEENAALLAQLSQSRERHADDITQRDATIAELQSQVTQLRGRLNASTDETEQLRSRLYELQEQVPDLQERHDLSQRLEQQKHTIKKLERLLEREQKKEVQTAASQHGKQVSEIPSVVATTASEPEQLRDKAVLCVGGRAAAVPVYRQMIEYSGARFLHHDGGEEEATRQLDASLAAADLVICQTGCISHGAYWRVKEHCKRTGKRCVFVEKPSASSLARCLRSLEGAADPSTRKLTAPG
jgi:hypothetical protein